MRNHRLIEWAMMKCLGCKYEIVGRMEWLYNLVAQTSSHRRRRRGHASAFGAGMTTKMTAAAVAAAPEEEGKVEDTSRPERTGTGGRPG